MSAGKTKSTPSVTGAPPIKKPMDKLLFVLTLMLIGAGIVTVFDASYATAIEDKGTAFYFVSRQARWAIVGLVAFFITIRVPYWKWRKYAIPAVAASLLMLIMVFIPHIGLHINGAKRWIGHGAVALQPSEFAKLALILYLAHLTAGKPNKIRSFSKGLGPALCVIGLLSLLIAKQPDLGTTLVLCGTGLIMLFIAGARMQSMGMVLAVVAGMVFAYSISKPYRLHRLISFLDPKVDQLNTGYQVWHALIALGSGGFIGRGLGDGIEKLYIPMAPTDFIFAVIGEEWGLIGTVTLVIVFLLVAARGFTIAYGTKDPFGSLLAAGITAMISLQTLINMAVVTSSIPNTGVPLPFISYGGSSLVLTMAAMGILLNISRYPEGRGIPEGKSQSKPTPSENEFDRRWHPGLYYPETGAYTRPPNAPLKRIDRVKR